MDEVRIEGDGYYLLAKRADRSWGHGVNIEVRNLDQELLGKLSFCCHPEIDGFDQCQKYTADMLFKIAAECIAQDLPLGRYQQAWASGINIIQSFNSPSA